MVFEGILVDVLNRFLGPYVKNLDPSQLKIGIWGGDVLLEKLELKENALDDLDLPIRVFGGYLERLRLKIPWKGLYSEPVVAELDGVYVLAGPAAAVKYDAEKEAKEQKERKEKQLKRIEEAKKKAKEQQEEKEGKEKAPGFVEKLITQIVRNVQITVKNIHIRYEDSITNPSRPFSFGVTLDSLFLQSTDESYEIGSTVSSDPTFPLIYKVVQMNCLAAYLNSHHKLFGSEPPEDWREILKHDIARPVETPLDLEYMVRPISARAEVQMTTNPKRAGGVPLALVCVELKELAVMLGKQQFHNIMGLVESFDRMTINQHFLKYKPVKPVKEDLKGWWHYAITAVLEEDVKRRTQMWSWKHIKQHWKDCRDYTEAYTKKLLSKSVSTSLKKQLEELEEKLSVFNITICRQRAENRAQEHRKSQEIARSKEGWLSWATGWGRTKSAEVQEEGAISDKDLQLEREKLYEAIGYSENAKIGSYSKEYVAQELRFRLNRVTARLYDGKGTVAHLVTQKVCVTVKHRPTCNNLSVTASVETLAITGKTREGKDTPPTIISTQHQEGLEKGSLLEVEYELHPVERKADQFIKANLLPIEITYDADTVDAIVGMFLLPKHVQLQKLSQAAASTLEDLKTQTRAGLEHAINQRKLLDIDISLHSPYLVVPENGVMTDSARVLVADLGLFQITSDMQYHTQSVRTASIVELEEAFYDHFNLKISNVHVMVSGPGDDWRAARSADFSPLHVLRPTGLQLELKKSLLPNDTRLPSLKVSGELPNLTLSLSDKKIKQVLTILHGLPIPPPSLANKPVETKYSHEKMATPSRMDTRRILGTLSDGLLVRREEEEKGGGEESDIEEEDEGEDDSEEFMTASEGEGDESSCKSKQPSPKPAKRQKDKTEDATGKDGEVKEGRKDSSGEVASTTKLWLQFTVHEIGIHFSEHHESTGKDTPRLNLIVSSVGTMVTLRSWDLSVEASVGSLMATDHYSKGPSGDPGTLLVTESTENMNFLSIKYSKYDRRAPHYPSLSGLTEQSLQGSVSLVKVRVQRESLANLAAITQSIVSVVIKKDVVSKGTEAVDQSSPKPIQDKERELPVRPSSARRLPNERDFHLDIHLAGLDIILCDSVSDVVRANITGLSTEVDLYKDKIAITASMANIAVWDSEPGSVHSEVITKVEEAQEIISVKVTVWQGATRGAGYSDLNQADLGVEARVQRLRVTIPLRFINRMKNFVTCLLSELNLDPSTIDSAREAAAKTASRTAEALKEQSSSRVRLSISIQAPVVVIPFFALSQSALVADLGQLEVSNKFLFASKLPMRDDNPAASFLSSSGLPAIVDHMTIRISSIQLGRVDDLRGQELVPSCENAILKPLKFEGHVTRRLSGWCTVIPAVDVEAKLETIEVCFSPADFEAVMSVVASLDEGKMELDQSAPASTPSAAEEKDRDSEREEKEEITTDPESSTSTAAAANIHIRAAVESVKLLLHSTDGVLADVALQGLSTDVSVLGTEIQVKAELSNIEVRDLSFTHYPKIVSLSEGEKAIKAQIVVYTAASKGSSHQDMNQCDLSVGMQVGRIRVAVLFLFINRLLCFVKQFEVSRKTIESAKKSAQKSATAAVSAVQGMRQNGQRLKLDIQIDAPEIIIPVSSQSNEALVIDLGQLNLSSTFHQHTVKGASFDGEKLPIYEKLSIMLTNLQMYRAIYDKKRDGNIVCRRQMLEPFTLDLCLKRNLSAAWYKGMPTIDVAAHLGTLQMLASGDDINMVCCVLTGNFREGSETRASLEAKEEEKTESKVSAEEHGAEMKEDATDKPPMDAGEEPYESVKFSAKLESVVLMLYKTGNMLDPLESHSWNRDPDFGLAQFTLLLFQAAASVQSTGAIEASASMENCILEDCRSENRGNITRMVEKVHGDSDQTETGAAEVEPMIAFMYKMSQWRDMRVFMKLDGMQVLVDVKFIKTLNNFIMTSIKPITKPIPRVSSTSGTELQESKSGTELQESKSGTELQESKSGTELQESKFGTELQESKSGTELQESKSGTELQESKSGTELQESKSGTEPPEYETLKPETHSMSSKSKSETADTGAKPAETSKITVRVKVTKPRIALLESSEQSNSSALVLGTDVDFMLVMSHGQLSMNTQVKELCVTSTWYKSLHVTDTKVLAPTAPISVSLNFLQGSNTVGRVSIPSLEIVLSPATVRLILHVAKLVAPDKSEENEIGVTAPIDLFKPKALDPWKWYFSPSWVEEGKDEEEEEGEGEGMVEDKGSSVDLPYSVGTEEITMEMECLKVLIERELPTGGTSPVVAIAMGKYGCKALTLSIREWSKQLTASAEISLEASYFSRCHDCWEPLLEPITDSHSENKYTAWTLAAEVEQPMLELSSDPHQAPQEELPPELAIKFSSKNALQLTLTKTSLRILMELVRAYTKVTVSEEVDAAAPETREAAYNLINKLGKDYPMTVEAKEGLKIHGAYSKVVKYRGDPLPLHPTEDWPQMQPGELPTEGVQRGMHILQLQIENFYPLDIIIGPYEKIYYPLCPRQPRSPKSRDGGNEPPIKYGLVVEIDRQAAGRTPTVIIRSPVQIVNHMDETVEVFWSKDPASHPPPTTNPIVTVAKDSTAVLPLHEAHFGQFFLRPKIEGLQTSHSPLSWRLPNKAPGDIPCYPKGTIPGEQSSKLPHYIRVNVDPEVYNKMPLSLGGRMRPHHIFHLHYPLLVHNLLPAVLWAEEAGLEMEIQPGTSAHFHGATLLVPHKVSIRVSLDNQTWCGTLSMGPKAPEYSTLTMSTEDQQQNNLVLMVHKEEKSTWHLSFYSPYWVMNKTTLTLQYSAKNASEVYTHPPSKTITLYPHKNIRIRVDSDHHYSEWSQPFSLDALGSEGIFYCKIYERVYQMGTEVHMSSFGLSRVVTISPFYMVYNMTRDDITFLEAGILTETTTVSPMTLVPFWPKAKTKGDSDTMQVAVNDPELLHYSVPFQYTGTKCLLMRTNGEIPAVEVEIQVTASANIITFNPYYTGVVPLQLVNDTDFIIEFQQGSKKQNEAADWLEPGETVMYTWDDPLAPREVIWNIKERPEKTHRVGTKDDSGDFTLPNASRDTRGSEVSSIRTASTFSRASRASRSSRGSTDSTVSALSAPINSDLPGMPLAELGTWEEEEGLEGVEEGDEDVMDDLEEWEKLDKVEDELDQPDFPRGGFFKIGSAALKAGRAIGSSFSRKIRRRKNKPNNRGYWICFMDGLQRVVLFTTNEAIQKHVLAGNKTERPHLELTLSLSAVGISLVNDLKRLEVAYIGLPSSDTIWETATHVRWKPVARDVKDSLENLYKDHEKTTGVVDLTSTNFWVDFNVSPMMLIDKKSGAKRKLRRSHFEGLFAQVTRSNHHTSFQARISNVQIDNTIPFALNPTILHAWPPPPVLSSKLAPKPFIEVSLIVKHTEQSNVNEITLLQVLIQEMGVTLDMGFILAMIRLMEGLSSTKVTEDTLIEEEVERSFLPLEKSKVATVSAMTTRNYFKLLHLSPLHLHLTFSLEESGWEKEAMVDSERNPVFGFAMNGFSSLATIIGRTKDAELKLGYFELENITSTDKQLRDKIIKHYVQEAAVNMYNVVLGLEVLGNPAGFIKGLKEGAVGLFYQPFEGAVLGPEEFFRGLSLGGRQFLGGTIGGFSGLVGRVTGVFGDTLAGLTFDKEFKENRKMSGGGGGTHSTSVGQGLEGAAKGLYEGVTGIVKQPLKGAKKGGVWGFVKGTGKGFVGVFVKPLGGLVDLTSATLTAVQKKTHVGDTDVTQIRASRFIGPDKIVYPYSLHKAEGYALFLAMDNGRLAESDMYFEHVELVEKPLKVLLVTSNRFAVIKRNEFFDKFDDDWRVDFSEIVECPSSKNNVISIPVKEQQAGGLTGFLSPRRGQRTTIKTLTVKTAQLAHKAVCFINQAYEEYRAAEKLEAQ